MILRNSCFSRNFSDYAKSLFNASGGGDPFPTEFSQDNLLADMERYAIYYISEYEMMC